jgi:hypothetical protein
VVEDILDARSAISPRYLLWRPWSERDRPFNLLTSSADFADYSANLFLTGRNFSLDCRYDSQGASPHYQATLTERPFNLGQVTLTGSSIYRLILKEEKGLVAILDQPHGTLQMPAGSYALEEIWLRKEDTEVARFKAGKITVPAGGVAHLTAGGPLTNSVDVRSSDYSLALTYQLKGADGGLYHFPRPNYERPPEFAIFEGTNRLATGKFAFG